MTPETDSPFARHRSLLHDPAEADLDLRLQFWRVVALIAGAALAILEFGFRAVIIVPWLNHVFQAAILGVYLADVWRRHLTAARLTHTRLHWDDWVLLCLAIVGAAGNLGLLLVAGLLGAAGESLREIAAQLWLLFQLAATIALVTESWRLNVALSRRFYRPGLLFPFSFLAIIAVGTVLLMVDKAVPEHAEALSFVDALFTTTSAVCVTGLTVVDTAQLTPYAHAVIAVLIQLGGLGIVIFGSVLAMLLGARLSLREDMTLSQMLNDQPLQRITAFVRFIVLGTLVIELCAALLLMPMWENTPGQPPMSLTTRFTVSLFHSVSAFCNAGFALQTTSLEGYRYHVLVHTVFVGLIVIGGIGFPVLNNIRRMILWRWRQRGPRRPDLQEELRLADGRLTLHSRIVLTTTAALYLVGMLSIAAAQLVPYLTNPAPAPGASAATPPANERPPLSALVIGRTLLDAHFMAVTSRTAGFNTMPMGELTPGSRFLIMTLMTIGASPGGTGGGLKTATLAVVLLTIAATLRGRRYTECGGRQISDELVRKALALAASFLTLIAVATLLLSFSESFPFEQLLFESISAASTTGLSLGITPALTGFGKVVIIVTMFLGRIGPLALLAGLLFRQRSDSSYSYPREEVVIG